LLANLDFCNLAFSRSSKQFVLAYNLGNFLREAVLTKAVRHWTMTTLREKLIETGAKFLRNSRKIVWRKELGEEALQKEPPPCPWQVGRRDRVLRRAGTLQEIGMRPFVWDSPLAV
jgi:hypothetical protein